MLFSDGSPAPGRACTTQSGPERLRLGLRLGQGHTALAGMGVCAPYSVPSIPSPQAPNSPGMATSYSTWNSASWLHCRSVARAVAWLAPCSGIPSTLSSLSPTFKEPSLRGRAGSRRLVQRVREQSEGREWRKEPGAERMREGTRKKPKN